jgi:uncharacterized membrane protein YoaK (UPF0700 family)
VAPVRSIDDSPSTKALPFVLSLIAGGADVIGFLGLGGLFVAHITGNLVVLAAHVAAGGNASLPHMISVPVFMLALAVTRLLAAALERARIAPLETLLLLQFVLLCAVTAICLVAGPSGPGSPSLLTAGMLGVCAMAVQNALVKLALAGAPSTATATGNITIVIMDLGELLLGRDAERIAKARGRVRSTWPAIAGFMLGCLLGTWFESALGLLSFALPAGLAFLACLLGRSSGIRPNH